MQAAALADLRSVAEHPGSDSAARLHVSPDSGPPLIAHHTLSARGRDRVWQFTVGPIDACSCADNADKRVAEATR